MKFSDILGMFNIRKVFKIENRVLGISGYLFRLNRSIAYLYLVSNKPEKSLLIFGKDMIKPTENQVNKIFAMIRFNRIKIERLRNDDLHIYSKLIEENMEELVDSYEFLEKGSSQLAFAPTMYTRFAESLVFDFDYIYDDEGLAELITNFDTYFKSNIETSYAEFNKTKTWNDDILYRELTEYVRQNKQSINGQIDGPTFLKRLFLYFHDVSEKNIVIDFGHKRLLIRCTNDELPLFISPSSQLTQYISTSFTIIDITCSEIEKILNFDIDNIIEKNII